MEKKLNLGCGEDYRSGWVNLDCRKEIKKDVDWNLDNFPYPFKKNTFDEVLMAMVLEHSQDPIGMIKEIIRISKPNAKIVITVPHANSYAAYSDLQHKHFFTEHTFSDWHLKEYEIEGLKLIKYDFIYDYQYKKYLPFKRFLKIYLNGIYDDIRFEFKIDK